MKLKLGTWAAVAWTAWAGFGGMPDTDEIVLPGDYPGHLQDVCWDGAQALYWAQTTYLIKTDLKGDIVRQVAVDEHNAGLQLRDGKLYVAVCVLQNKTGGKTTPACRVQIDVHDAESLALLETIKTDINDRSGSLCILDDGSFLVGCLRHPELAPDEVRFHHVARDGRLVKSYVQKLDHPVKLGIEVIKRRGDRYFLCIYGHADVELDKDFRRVRTHDFRGSCGTVFDGDDVWVGVSKTISQKPRRYTSSLRRKRGAMKPVPAEEAYPSFGGSFTLPAPAQTFSLNCVKPVWEPYALTGDPTPDAQGRYELSAKLGRGAEAAEMKGTLEVKALDDGTLHFAYAFAPSADVSLKTFYLQTTLPSSAYLHGGTVKGGACKKAFPEEADFQFFRRTVSDLQLRDAKGRPTLSFAFDKPVPVVIQDNRRLSGCDFSLRLGVTPCDVRVKAGEPLTLGFTLRGPVPYKLGKGRSFRLAAGKDWIPLPVGKPWLKPGSALDFSAMPWFDAPAGKHGRVVARGENFEFERLPGVPQRFLGVNLCFSACVPPEEYAAPFAADLRRFGYNAVRFHHHDGALTEGSADGVSLNPVQMRRFDALFAAFVTNGIYVTTDLYVSRPVAWRQIGFDRDGLVADKNEYKELLLVHEPAYSNFIAYARNFLGHRNPFTGRTYAEEPALGFLSFVNEGNPGNRGVAYFADAPYRAAFSKWLAEKKAGDARYAAVPDELPTNLKAETPVAAAWCQFLKDMEIRFATRVNRFLREEMKCAVLTTDMNGWTNPTTYQLVRNACYGYMDDHRYVDHPSFIGKARWTCPMKCANVNTLANDSNMGILDLAQRRILTMPYTVTEFNYSGPGEYRAAGGLILGAQAALQNWGALWRFAWSHSERGIVQPEKGAATTFDLAGDPLNLASERAFMTLFLRRDLPELTRTACLVLPEGKVADEVTRCVDADAVRFRSIAWWVKLGSVIAESAPSGTIDLGAFPKVFDRTLKSVQAEVFGPTAAGQLPVAGDGRVKVDPRAGSLEVATDRTAAGYRERGTVRAGVLEADVGEVPAQVCLTAVDGAASIAASRRLVLSHLTDLHSTGMTWADRAHTITLGYGRPPHLVKAGRARVRLALPEPTAWEVWAISLTGERLARIPAEAADGRLAFTADVARDPAHATLLYEIVQIEK